MVATGVGDNAKDWILNIERPSVLLRILGCRHPPICSTNLNMVQKGADDGAIALVTSGEWNNNRSFLFFFLIWVSKKFLPSSVVTVCPDSCWRRAATPSAPSSSSCPGRFGAASFLKEERSGFFSRVVSPCFAFLKEKVLHWRQRG